MVKPRGTLTWRASNVGLLLLQLQIRFWYHIFVRKLYIISYIVYRYKISETRFLSYLKPALAYQKILFLNVLFLTLSTPWISWTFKPTTQLHNIITRLSEPHWYIYIYIYIYTYIYIYICIYTIYIVHICMENLRASSLIPSSTSRCRVFTRADSKSDRRTHII